MNSTTLLSAFLISPDPTCAIVFQLQHLAASCVQRNIRKLMAIREWPWWRLYMKVKPLLNVHRTEEELHEREVGPYQQLLNCVWTF